MEEKREHYVYVIFRADGSPCYVGKGCGKRYKVHLYNTKNIPNKHLARIIEKERGRLAIVKLREYLSEPESFEIETAFILAIGRIANGGPLVNQTDGGGGMVGYKHSEETKRQKSIDGKVRGFTNSARLASIAACKGKPSHNRGKSPSQETRDKLSASCMGRIPWNIGISRPQSTIDAIIATKKSRQYVRKSRSCSTETMEKIGNGNRGENNGWFGKVGPNSGRAFSEETRARMSASHKRRSELKRQNALLQDNTHQR